MIAAAVTKLLQCFVAIHLVYIYRECTMYIVPTSIICIKINTYSQKALQLKCANSLRNRYIFI